MNATPVEEWRAIPGYEGLYEVSDLGRVRSLSRIVTERTGKTRHHQGRVLSQWIGVANGYPFVSLKNGEHKTNWCVHRLVAIAFLGTPEEGQEVCHLNGDRLDPRLINLRWDTHSANVFDRRKHGTDHQVNKTHCPRGHLLAGENLVKRARESEKHHRKCRACNRARSKYPLDHPNFVSHADWQYMRLMGGVVRRDRAAVV